MAMGLLAVYRFVFSMEYRQESMPVVLGIGYRC